MNNQREHRLSHFACEMLERILVGNFWVTAVDTGTQTVKKTDAARFAWEAHRKWMGIKPHHLDLYIYQRHTGIYVQIELKVGNKGPTHGQGTTMRLLHERGISAGCCWDLREVYRFVIDAGFELHGNADRIVLEVLARYEAAEREAELKVPQKRVSKPRAVKPTASKLRVTERLRREVQF